MDRDVRSSRLRLLPGQLSKGSRFPQNAIVIEWLTLPLNKNTSVYRNEYTSACHNNTQVQTNFLANAFANSTATWKFLQLHHPYASVSTNETDLAPLIDIVEKHHGIVLNGHDHCLGHFFLNNTNFILSGAAGYPQAGDCNNGTAQGPYALYLAANNLTGE